MNGTKQRIVDTAERLFNESGTAAISTNHIASSMGISPGNLYYHFANKDEIVVAAIDRLEAALDDAWQDDAAAAPGMDQLERGLEGTCRALREHRFLARELFALCCHGGSLRRRCGELVKGLARHLSGAIAAPQGDGAPVSGAAPEAGLLARSVVPVLLAWDTMGELGGGEGAAPVTSDAETLARWLRASHAAALAGGAEAANPPIARS